jgi:catechol 2,3-dioxygenase-like lactoylglutathione lyase family enzyme
MSVSGLDHLLILTDDIDATRDFWCGALGLEVGERPPLEFRGYWLYSQSVPCIHIADRATYTAHSARIGIPASPQPVDHVAFAGEDYDELIARLERSGVEAARNDPPGAGIRQLFIEDPNGLKIELNVTLREE